MASPTHTHSRHPCAGHLLGSVRGREGETGREEGREEGIEKHSERGVREERREGVRAEERDRERAKADVGCLWRGKADVGCLAGSVQAGRWSGAPAPPPLTDCLQLARGKGRWAVSVECVLQGVHIRSEVD